MIKAFIHYLNNKEARVLLREAAFTKAEIRRLQRFYRRYTPNEMDQTSLDLRHLEFVRWLVASHRLSDWTDDKRNACEEQCPHVHWQESGGPSR